MSLDIKPAQHLLLWRLAAGGGEDFVVNLPAENVVRAPLVRAGLLAEDRRVNPQGKSKIKVKHLTLTQAGWAWCQENMNWPAKARSTKAGDVLGLLLPRLSAIFQRRAPVESLGEFIHQSEPAASAAPELDLYQAIRDACRALGNGQEAVRIRLADLRSRLVGFHPAAVTQALWDLSEKGELSLYRLDDPREIQPADRAAAVLTSTGEEKHILYFGGMAS